MRTDEAIMMGFGSIGVLIYFFGFLLPMKRASAAAGRPWRMVPVCFLGDYCDRVIAHKEAEKQRLIDLARTRQAPPSAVCAPRALMAATGTGTATTVQKAYREAPLPIGRAKQMPCYYGRASISNLGPNGELFVFLEQPLTDTNGQQHVEMATDVMVPPEALPFIEHCIRDMRMLLVNGIPANVHEIRLRMTIQTPEGRLVPMREWILEQALMWRPMQAVFPTNSGSSPWPTPLTAAHPPARPPLRQHLSYN